MGDAARLGWYAVVEALTLLRWLVATVLSILGVARVDGVFAALRGNADRQRDWASDRLGRSGTRRPTRTATGRRARRRGPRASHPWAHSWRIGRRPATWTGTW